MAAAGKGKHAGWIASATLGVGLSLAPMAWAGQTPTVTDDDPLPGQPGATAEAPKLIFKGMVIACIGDEWTLPNPAEKMKVNSYPVALERLINAKYGPGFVKVVVAGQARATIFDYDKLYDAKLAKVKADWVILQDSDKPVTAVGFKMDLTKLAAKIKANLSSSGVEPKLLLLETYHEPEYADVYKDKMRQFQLDHNWGENNLLLEQFATQNGAHFVQLRTPLGNGYGAMRDLNYTHPFKADGLVPTYIGATLIALRILQSLGENIGSYNFNEFEFPDKVRTAMVGLAEGKMFAGGVAVESTAGSGAGVPGTTGAKPSSALKSFDAALRNGQSAMVVYFGSDLTYKAAWVAQNSAFLSRVYGPKVAVVNAGKAGDNSQTALTRLKTDVLDRKPSLVLVEFSFADARDAANVSVDASKKNLTSMVQSIRKAVPDCDVVLMTPHVLAVFGEGDDRRSDLDGYIKIVREVAQAEKAGLIDHAADWSAWILNDRPRYNGLMGDNYLPNIDGHGEFNRKAAEFFRANLPYNEAKP